MPYLSGLDGVNEGRGMGQHGGMGKAGGEHVPTVDAGHGVVMLIAAQRLRLANQG